MTSKKQPLVSVIILNYNGQKIIEHCLNSVLKSTYKPIDIILVDNNSDLQETKQLKRKYRNKINFIRTGRNLGYAGGNNLGAANANGKYLVFLNNDTQTTPNWLEHPIKKMEADSKIGFLQPKIRWLLHKNYFEYCGGCGGFIDFFGFPFTRGRIFGSIEEDIGQYDDGRRIFWATGAVLFCRRKTFEILGGFDSYFFAQVEDEDISFRALRAGYHNIYDPKSLVYHLGSFTGGRNTYNKTFFNYRNHLVLLIKNLSVRELIFVLPVKIFFDFLASWYYLFFFQSWKMFRGVWSAYLFFLFDFHNILYERRHDSIKNFGYPKGNSLVYYGSIIFQCYLLGRKRWGKIFLGKDYQTKIINLFSGRIF